MSSSAIIALAAALAAGAPPSPGTATVAASGARGSSAVRVAVMSALSGSAEAEALAEALRRRVARASGELGDANRPSLTLMIAAGPDGLELRVEEDGVVLARRAIAGESDAVRAALAWTFVKAVVARVDRGHASITTAPSTDRTPTPRSDGATRVASTIDHRPAILLTWERPSELEPRPFAELPATARVAERTVVTLDVERRRRPVRPRSSPTRVELEAPSPEGLIRGDAPWSVHFVGGAGLGPEAPISGTAFAGLERQISESWRASLELGWRPEQPASNLRVHHVPLSVGTLTRIAEWLDGQLSISGGGALTLDVARAQDSVANTSATSFGLAIGPLVRARVPLGGPEADLALLADAAASYYLVRRSWRLDSGTVEEGAWTARVGFGVEGRWR